MNCFQAKLIEHGLKLERGPLQTLQINVGRKCNQTCGHCHVDAAPWRTEMMDGPTAGRIARWIQTHRPAVLDITGGAPELSEHFRFFVETGRASGCHVIDRCNLTIIETTGYAWLPEYLAAQQVEVIASLPCYIEENVNAQRGQGVFAKSIRALKKLNAAGYGTRLPLNLVYNPLGAKLPPAQTELELDYKKELRGRYGIEFSSLFTITNQPIARFADDLRERGALETYFDLLARSFNPATVENLMCRSTLSVGWRGEVYDCDFNQMLGMQLTEANPGGHGRTSSSETATTATGSSARKLFLWDVTPACLDGREVATGRHCLACTAGCGSSCTGALEKEVPAIV